MDGQIAMDTLPLDLEGVLAELAGDDVPRRRHAPGPGWVTYT